jgi:hypothetical protein
VNREELIQRAADVIAWEEVPPTIFIDRTHLELRMDEAEAKTIAESVLDAILPQVTTVEELEALPGALVVDGGNRKWEVGHYYLTSIDKRQDLLRHYEAVEVLAPLTIVWQP